MGDTVRRPAGPWTPAVHALLHHLEAAGFEAAPRALGLDSEGREVVSYADFKKLGSMKEAKLHGVYRLESKTYVIKDGDIMHILAST